MERDYENRHRQQSRIIINDYPSSRLPPPKRPKFWGDTPEPGIQPRPQRALSYVETPCIPREITASDKSELPPKYGLLSTGERAYPTGGDNKCKQDVSGSGVSATHCNPCYMSSALYAGDRSSGNRSSLQAPASHTAAEVMRLSSLVATELESAAVLGCGSIVKPTTQTAKPVKLHVYCAMNWGWL